MTAFLPQHDPQAANREKELTQSRQKYAFNYEYVNSLAMCGTMPLKDEFSKKWAFHVGQTSQAAFLNVLEILDDSSFKTPYITALKKITSAAAKSRFDTEKFFAEILKVIVDMVEDTHPESMQEYADMFRRIGLPPICRYYQQDRMFVNQRLAGPNPMMLQRMTAQDKRFPVTQKHFEAALPGDSLEAAQEEGRLYWVDYHILEGLKTGMFPKQTPKWQKYVYAPMAMFAVDKKTRELKPIAIQCRQQPADDNPIFTPKHGWNWQLAKMIVEIADGNVHQTVTHLGRTHLLMEPFVVVTHRQLAANHPVSMLLRPHFAGTLYINFMAHQFLIADDNIVDRLLAGTIDESRRLTVENVKNYPFNDAMLHKNLQARGVDDTELLPHYPYRDDSLLYWDVIKKWVEKYLSMYYRNDAELAADYEVKAWYDELVAQDGGRIPGLGKDGGITTVDYLVDVVTMIIFTSSVQHAAVNFPQADLFSYVPNMPLAGYMPAPTSTEKDATEADYIAMLPPKDQTLVQLAIGQLLGNGHYTQLGQYEAKHFQDQAVKDALKTFKFDIGCVGEEIDRRNCTRHPYVYLTPTGIPQSINI